MVVIADDGQRGAEVREGAHDLLLQRVGVLVLIDDDVPHARRESLPRIDVATKHIEGKLKLARVVHERLTLQERAVAIERLGDGEVTEVRVIDLRLTEHVERDEIPAHVVGCSERSAVGGAYQGEARGVGFAEDEHVLPRLVEHLVAQKLRDLLLEQATAERVDGSDEHLGESEHGAAGLADAPHDAGFQLGGGALGEGKRDDVARLQRVGTLWVEEVRDAASDDLGLARTRAGQDLQVAAAVRDGFSLGVGEVHACRAASHRRAVEGTGAAWTIGSRLV